MEKNYIISIDQGTSSSRAIIFDYYGNIVQLAQKETTQIYPQNGWVEHDALEIWGTQSGVLREVLERANISPRQIAAIGITNQRETTVVWDKNTGQPIYNAIVWQCRRTAAYCDKLKENAEFTHYVHENTGLLLDSYFSGTKLKWIIDNVKGAREKAINGDLLFGTIDTWLIWKMTKGIVHATDYSNASRTMLFNIKTLKWDEKILAELDIPLSMLPKVKDSSGIFGYTHKSTLGGANIPIAGVAGDQQAALFWQCCFTKGTAKNTYGTGCFALMNTGDKIITSKNGLLSTIGWKIGDEICYALEGSIFMAGAVVQWLRDGIGLIREAEDTEYFATKVQSSGGVYFVPAFVGLGTPYWDMYARGTIIGITRDTKREHIIRAALEGIAYQAKDVFETMQIETGVEILNLKVDGGAVNNKFLMQFQSDILNTKIIKTSMTEVTALGSAFLAGLAVGFWKNKMEIESIINVDIVYKPNYLESKMSLEYKGWKKAVDRSKNWIDK